MAKRFVIKPAGATDVALDTFSSDFFLKRRYHHHTAGALFGAA
jgi:hypothetical protein